MGDALRAFSGTSAVLRGKVKGETRTHLLNIVLKTPHGTIIFEDYNIIKIVAFQEGYVVYLFHI